TAVLLPSPPKTGAASAERAPFSRRKKSYSGNDEGPSSCSEPSMKVPAPSACPSRQALCGSEAAMGRGTGGVRPKHSSAGGAAATGPASLPGLPLAAVEPAEPSGSAPPAQPAAQI